MFSSQYLLLCVKTPHFYKALLFLYIKSDHVNKTFNWVKFLQIFVKIE